MEELQSLLEKINREGVEKADAQAAKIIADAQAKADQIVKTSREMAAKAKADAEQTAADYANRAADTVRQAARDVVLGVKDSITALLEQLLVKDVEKSLADEAAAAELIKSVIAGLANGGEIVCGEKLAKTLSAQLASQKQFTITADPTLTSGFSIKLDGGRVEHAYTAEVIAAELAKRLRPDLAKLVK